VSKKQQKLRPLKIYINLENYKKKKIKKKKFNEKKLKKPLLKSS
jgi:hypothetical protein